MTSTGTAPANSLKHISTSLQANLASQQQPHMLLALGVVMAGQKMLPLLPATQLGQDQPANVHLNTSA